VVVKDIPSDDSPAKKAGMEPGDIIVAIDGKPVGYVGQLQQEVGFRKPGDVVKVEVARKGGVRKTFEVKLQPLQDAPQLADNARPGSDSENAGTVGSFVMRRMGASVQPVTPQIAEQLQLPADARGLVVTDVTPGGPAWDALLDESRGGPDIILAVEGKPVKTEADLRAALKDQAPGSVVTLRLYNPRLGRRIERVKLADKP
jgi:serine protease Do